ncbi:uncharacterized protein LOC126738841 isoform X2 [Anthonomus grandis grandis]|uniref:uncharacterized protein LOC126738841 isoform X2 n=1 Tax=Anthonomus grandis grandis TaxID=2921223 RepID=UPI0021666C0B|nr:uncharacterized protein LOC126738841 isoform X2 [Anthonomus grandis grandis]
MMKQPIGICLAALLFSSSLISSLAYPNSHPRPEYKKSLDATQQHQQQLSERKFAEKSNSIKKVALDDLDDVQTNEISQTGTAGGGFSWSNLLGGAAATGPNKSEGLDESGVVPTSPWANLLSMGLKILSAILGGGVGAQTDGIDKVDNGGSPLQGVLAAVVSTLVGGRDPQQVNMLAKQAGEFINIVVNLLDALKTSFSHRSLAARNIGRKDSVSEAAVAGITMAKGYVRSLGTNESTCMAKYMCQANNECSTDIGRSSLFCNLGSYAASFVLDKSTSKTTFDLLYEAGRRGRSGENCEMGYLECNEIY